MQATPTIAALRFGTGARQGEIDGMGADPIANLKGQLQAAPEALVGMQSAVALLAEYRRLSQAAKEAKQEGQSEGAQDAAKERTKFIRSTYVQEAASALNVAASSDSPFLERLSLFWANHFTVSGRGGIEAMLAGAFVREAIRPHLTGTFAELLTAAVKHPAMLVYLNNDNSVGPNSPLGKKRKKGLNENLAREIMELHTLGSNGGYTPKDVTNFARLLTGWSIARKDTDTSESGFVFRTQTHERGPIELLGNSWDDTTLKEGEAFLAQLATSAKTARHIATKLVAHFIADEPPPACVAAVEAAFVKSNGDLKTCYSAMLDSAEAWEAPLSKYKTPQHFLVSALRGLGQSAEDKALVRFLSVTGQSLWQAPSPKGWPDDEKSWLSESGMNGRLQLATRLAAQLGGKRSDDITLLAVGMLGDTLSDETETAIKRAGDRKQALTILLMSPEFQRH